MIGDLKAGALERSIISGVSHKGIEVTTADGRPARLAVIDADGNVIETGQHVADEAFAVAVNVYRNFLAGKGWLRVLSKPAGAVGGGALDRSKSAA